MKTTGYVLLGALIMLIVLITFKLGVLFGFLGIAFCVWLASFVDWSGKGDGRQHWN